MDEAAKYIARNNRFAGLKQIVLSNVVDHDRYNDLSESFPFPKLEQCIWSIRSGVFDLRIFGDGNKLTRLNLSCFGSALIKPCLLPSLIELYIYAGSLDATLKPFLHGLPNLATLTLRIGRKWEQGCIIDVLQALGDSNTNGEIPCPLLEELTVGDPVVPQEELERLLDPILAHSEVKTP
jgi:hypothetical protein